MSTELLGLRLAPPRRRLAAFVLDGIFIVLLTWLTSSFALILGVVAAVFFIRAGFRRTPLKRSVFGRAMRGSVGCLGIVIALVTAALWEGFGPSFSREGTDSEPRVTFTIDGNEATGPVRDALQVLAEVAASAAFQDAETLEEAQAAAIAVIDAAQELDAEPEETRALLLAAVPERAEWADEAPALVDRLLDLEAREPIESRELGAVVDEVSLYSTEEALTAYARLLGFDSDSEMEIARRNALAARLASEVAADTLRTLQLQIDALEDRGARQQRRLDEVEEALEEADGGGFFRGMLDFLDELGFGFGWATLYMTVMLSWWKGQTLGKRIMRIRVLRLDGEPINWWIAFERAGGYAAGLATGLLGFAQIYWDSNRQAIHDRIVGTVVVIDGAEKVIDWEAAL